MSHRCNKETCLRHQTPRKICANCRAKKHASEHRRRIARRAEARAAKEAAKVIPLTPAE